MSFEYLLSNGEGVWRRTWNIVKAVGHRSIFHNIAGMQDVSTRRWNLHLEMIRVVNHLRTQAHAGEKLANGIRALSENKTDRKGIRKEKLIT